IKVFARPHRCPLQTLDLGNGGDGADRDDEIDPADGPPVDLEDAGSNDASTAAVKGDSERAKLAPAVGIVQTGRDRVASDRRGAVGESSLIETQRSAHRADRVGAADPMADLRRVKHRLARHAGEVRALASE